MSRSLKELFPILFKSKRKVARFFDRCTLLLLAFCLPLLLLIEGGIDHATHALIIPLFSLLLVFHGLTVFLKSRASIKPFKLSLIQLLFVPFLIWLIFSANFISATPWKGHISVIYFFEAFIVLWVACNHLKGFRRLQTVCVGLLLMGSYSLFLGYSQFFHGRDGSLQADYINNISGLFHDSTAYAFLICISLAVIIPAFFLRFMIRGKRVVFFITGLLLLFGLIIAQDIQGYILAPLVVLLSSFFAFRKREHIISFNALTLVLVSITFGMLVLFMPSFSKHFALPYYFEGQFYFLEVLYGSMILCFKSLILGTGIGAFSTGILAVKSQSYPLLLDNPSNSFLMLLSEGGILGASLLLVPIYYVLKKSFLELKQLPKWEFIENRRWIPMERFVLSVSLSFLLSFLVCSLCISVSLFPFFLCLGAFALGALSMVGDTSIIVLNLKKNITQWSYLFFASLLGLTFGYDATRSIKSASHLELAEAFYSQSFEVDETAEVGQKIDILNQSASYVDLAIKENPKNFDALLLKNEILNAFYSKNEIYYEHHLEALLGTSKKVVDSAGNYWRAYLRYGASLAIIGESDKAEKVLRKSLKIAPQSLEANLYVAAFLMHFEDHLEESRRYLYKALEIDPANPLALAINRKLNI